MQPGERITLQIEKAVAGGRMLARHGGAVVLVAAAIPGETVEAEIEKVQRHTVWAATRRVLEPSPDRIDPFCEWSCGGSVYAHVRLERQIELKRGVMRDAFQRIARMTLDEPIPVAASPPDGYRMRARLHVGGGRIGFYREGTHALCDPGPTRQLLPATIETIKALEQVLSDLRLSTVRAVSVAENRDATQRAVHLELDRDSDPSRLASGMVIEGVTGVSCAAAPAHRALTLTGTPEVTDTVANVRLTRHVCAFFQSNRYLLPDLVTRVCALVPAGRVVDLYSGVGPFSVPLAAGGEHEVIAVEGDPVAAEDLKRNIAPYATRATARHQHVEAFLSAAPADVTNATTIVDPPRTGLSREALLRLLAAGPARIVYVSCDIATLARDVRSCVERGYLLSSCEAFDMFPHTAHVESLALLIRQ